MRFEQITLDNGLSQSNVFTILQDSDGFMWFGTENGLNRFNGYDFTVFKRQRGNPEALFSDYVYDLAEDGDGNLWIVTNGGGLATMDRKSNTVTTYRHDPANPNGISSNVVRALLVDDDGTVWLGTRGAGLDRFDSESGEFTNYRFGASADPTRDPNEIYVLYGDATGALWIGSNAGLVRMDKATGRYEHYSHDPAVPASLSDHRVRAIFEDSDGRLWIGTYGGLNLFDGDKGEFRHFRHDPDDASSIAGDRVTSLFEDSNGRLWVGTYGGLNLMDRAHDTFVRYTHDSQDGTSLGDDAVTAIFEDRSGVLWVGTRNRGLSKWNPRTWSYGHENGREITASEADQPNVTSFVEDDAGLLWIGTFGEGVNAIDRESGSVTKYRHDPSQPDSISDDFVMSLMRDRAGAIWLGTMRGGLNRLDPKTGKLTTFRHDAADPTSLSADGVMSIFEDSKGLVWVGTFGGGISRFDPATGQFTRFIHDPSHSASLSSNRVHAFAEDGDGRMWIATDAGGLNLFDPQTESFHQFRHDPADPHTLAADSVYSLSIAADGTVWVGTRGGLDRVVGDPSKPASIRFANVSQADGLANDVIYGVQIDDAGTLWLSTNYGISRFDPASGAIKNMHRRDGLQSEEFNFGAHYKSGTGELFFGGHNGYNAFHPEKIRTNSIAPLIALTGFFNSNEPLKEDLPRDEDGQVEITYKDDVVSFEFAALDYTAPDQNRYMYKLEGFDKDWIDLGNRRRVTYTDLDDGNYLLRVKAANSDGVWNEAGYALPLRVAPAPWDTWWAYLGYLAMFAQLVVALWLGHRRKIRREEEYSQRLEEEVRERTEELVESNKKLRDLNQSLQESSLSDPLTGLRNRRFVFEEVSRDIEVIRRRIEDEQQGVSAKKVSDLVFMMIDLDNFKPINDTYGHAAGDQMLLEVRDVLLGTCRKSDFVIRWGGDEFVVIAKQARPGEAEALAERIRTKIAAHNFVLNDGQIVRTTCSIGFAAYPLFRSRADDADLDQILTLADSLMYEAKRQRNAWAGMLSPSEAATSVDFDHESIEATSLLFRAKRAGQLLPHPAANEDDAGSTHMTTAG